MYTEIGDVHGAFGARGETVCPVINDNGWVNSMF